MSQERTAPGIEALKAQKPQEALAHFRQAALAAPKDATIPFHEALAHRALGDGPSEMAALDRALTCDPDYFPALLGKGVLLARMGKKRAAAKLYRRVIERAPPEDRLPPALREGLVQARQAVAEDAAALEDFLKAATGNAPSARAAEALSILAGTKPVQTQHAELLYFPQLPAIPFHARENFAWIEALEAQTGAIRDEFLALTQDDLTPYVALPANEPLGPWTDLNHSPRWNSFYLWKDGQRRDEACARAPRTAAALAAIPQVCIPGFAPTAFFSVLAAHAHLPAHAGSTNIRLTAHLPLVLPGPARFRVGNTTRPWRAGQCWVFDDTIEHEAWNEADRPRAILIFDVWNPLLAEDERSMTAALLTARRAWYQE